jgi:uncharacterized protein
MDNFIINRSFWLDKILDSWKKAPIVWLSGVRRAGKTTLVKSLKNALYINCDLPSEIARLSDPESFFASVSTQTIIFDEIHSLPDPSKVLKIGADAFPQIKILATGSSTLAATKKFSDSLTGRKREVLLSPVLFNELADFGIKDLEVRMQRGGLPPSLLRSEIDFEFFSEWLDSYYARDVKELFNIDKRSNFLKLVQILLASNGELVDFSKLATIAELSRPTVMNYMDALEISHVINIIRPFHGGKKRELIKQPKIYGFDTGFVAFAKGYKNLRPDDMGLLWENMVLDLLLSAGLSNVLRFWRDEKKNEIDFILNNGSSITAIECKFDYNKFNPKAMHVFRSVYPIGKNYVLSPNIKNSFLKKFDSIEVNFLKPQEISFLA